MEQKLVRVPFEVGMAKKITSGEVSGRVVTRDGRSARIICWDRKGKFPIIALIDNGDDEVYQYYYADGIIEHRINLGSDLMLEIPEYTMFKDGDVIAFGNCDDALNIAIFEKRRAETNHKGYVSLGYYSGSLTYDYNGFTLNNARFATEEEKQKLIDALKADREPKAKEYLKRFFGIEQKQEYEFKPFDKVICKSDYSEWMADMFSHVTKDGLFACIGCIWKYCIPYNEKTKHLLGTTDNWEE